MPCTPVSVSFELVTDDQLEKITFGLNKTCNPDDSSGWDISFELDQRQTPTGTFELVVQLNVDVNVENNTKAQATASRGLDQNQASYALGPAATAARDYQSGAGSFHEAQKQAQNVIAVRQSE